MVRGKRIDRGRAGLGQGPLGVEQIELAELPFAVADPRDPCRFHRGCQRRPARGPGRDGGGRHLGADPSDCLGRVQLGGAAQRIGLVALCPRLGDGGGAVVE